MMEMTQNRGPQKPNTSPVLFDWEGLPLHQCSEALRQLGTALLDHTLNPKATPTPKLWEPFLWNTEEMFHTFPGSKQFPHTPGQEPKGLRNRLRHGLTALKDQPILAYNRRRLRSTGKKSHMTVHWKSFKKRLIKDSMTRPNRGKLMTLLMSHRFYGPKPFILPAHLWRATGRLAFSQPSFQYHVARKVLAFLRPKVVINPARMPTPVFSANTFWVLIALYRPDRPSFWRRLNPSWKRHLNTIEKLARVGNLQAQVSGWAGFWDQWLILHSLHQRTETLIHLEKPLREAVKTLPLLKATSLSWPKEPTKKSKKHSAIETRLTIADDSWQCQGPGWLFQLYESKMWEVATGV